ncbi:MAG: fatty acyl-AMP ligase [Alphaproteobacteria bacterium]
MRSTIPTTNSKLEHCFGGFETVAEGLDYAARGETGISFYSVRGEVRQQLTYAELRDRAVSLALRFEKAGFERGARVAIIAATDPEFFAFFFACQYANLIPVPLPLPINLGGRESYVARLRKMIESAGAAAAVASKDLIELLREAVSGLPVRMVGAHEDFRALPAEGGDLRPSGKDDLCYIQYSSGSTRFPHGVTISQRSVTSNTRSITRHGLCVRSGDRCVSWLPLYHDMGLVGFCITPVLSQMSVDYIATTDFARRPLLWLKVLSANRGTLAFSPTFGYDLCSRRGVNGAAGTLDLSSWRVAGIGGEMIRANVIEQFADCFAEFGFRRSTFLASYGLAESTLAVTFASLDGVLEVDRVNRNLCSTTHQAVPAGVNGEAMASGVRDFVLCGPPMPGHAIAIRDENGADLPDRRIGTIHVKGPSLMVGYFGDPEATARVFADESWLDTGDMGYIVDGSLVVTGRKKDMIICNGRNLWAQDIEWEVETLPGVRRGDVAAFSVTENDDAEAVVLVVECRLTDREERRRLRRQVAATVRSIAGVDCKVILAPRRSLPHTSSGKLSRSSVKEKYLSGLYSETDHGGAERSGDRAAQASGMAAVD